MKQQRRCATFSGFLQPMIIELYIKNYILNPFSNNSVCFRHHYWVNRHYKCDHHTLHNSKWFCRMCLRLLKNKCFIEEIISRTLVRNSFNKLISSFNICQQNCWVYHISILTSKLWLSIHNTNSISKSFTSSDEFE